MTKNIDNLDTGLQHSNIAPSSVFIDLFGLSSEEDVPSFVQGLKAWHAHDLSIPLELVFYWPTSNPSTSIALVHLVIDLHIMLGTKHVFNELCNLDYDKIVIQIISFLPTTFNKNILFELPPLSPNDPSSSHMQGMDRKCDGHAWSKVITTNIKNNFGFSFKKIHYLDHLHCVQIDYSCFVCSNVCNEITWVKESTHLSMKG